MKAELAEVIYGPEEINMCIKDLEHLKKTIKDRTIPNKNKSKIRRIRIMINERLLDLERK